MGQSLQRGSWEGMSNSSQMKQGQGGEGGRILSSRGLKPQAWGKGQTRGFCRQGWGEGGGAAEIAT